MICEQFSQCNYFQDDMSDSEWVQHEPEVTISGPVFGAGDDVGEIDNGGMGGLVEDGGVVEGSGQAGDGENGGFEACGEGGNGGVSGDSGFQVCTDDEDPAVVRKVCLLIEMKFRQESLAEVWGRGARR